MFYVCIYLYILFKYFINFRFDCSCILCTESFFPLIFCFICLSHAILAIFLTCEQCYLFLVPLACHILECCDGLAQNVIGTIGQAFELQFKQYLHSPPKAIPTMDRCDSNHFCINHILVWALNASQHENDGSSFIVSPAVNTELQFWAAFARLKQDTHGFGFIQPSCFDSRLLFKAKFI